MINLTIPEQSKILEEYNNVDGFPADGEIYYVFQLTQSDLQKLQYKALANGWRQPPLESKVKEREDSFMNGLEKRNYNIPARMDGVYFFAEGNGRNFVFAYLDKEQNRLYIVNRIY